MIERNGRRKDRKIKLHNNRIAERQKYKVERKKNRNDNVKCLNGVFL